MQNVNKQQVYRKKNAVLKCKQSAILQNVKTTLMTSVVHINKNYLICNQAKQNHIPGISMA